MVHSDHLLFSEIRYIGIQVVQCIRIFHLRIYWNRLMTGLCARPRKVFESGDQTGLRTKGGAYAPRARPKDVLGRWVREGPPPENFEKLMCKMEHFGTKLYFVVIQNKVQFWPTLLTTNSFLKYMQCVTLFTVITCVTLCTLNNPHAIQKLVLYTLIVGVFDPLFRKWGSINPMTLCFRGLCYALVRAPSWLQEVSVSPWKTERSGGRRIKEGKEDGYQNF